VLICLLYGVVAFIVFTLFGLRYALVMGIVAGLLYAVPYVGPVTTALMVLAVSLVQHPDRIVLALAATASTAVLNQVFDMGLTPKLLGGAVGLHPVLSIFALMAGGAAYGIPGMVLAVPVAASVQVVLCELFPRLREPLGKFGTKREARKKRSVRSARSRR